MLETLATDIARLGAAGTWSPTAVPHLILVALDERVAPLDLLYEPMVCFVADGTKHTAAGERIWMVERGQMFINTLVLPVTATFERVPYRAAVLQLDNRTLADLLLEMNDPNHHPPPAPDAHTHAPMTPDILDAVHRWVRLLDTPDDINLLGPSTEREILYRLLRSPLGPLLRQSTRTGSLTARIHTATAWIAAHLTEPVDVDSIAAMTHMSTATLHRHFKAATGMSPLRFHKHLRLHEARRLLTTGDTTAARVAEQVGYNSPTQFNREYRRAFGLPPLQDASRLRNRLTPTDATTRTPAV